MVLLLLLLELNMLVAHKIDVFVGKRLKMARVLRDMTQFDLGTKVGVTLQQVQKYERGCNRVSASKLWLMAKALRVSVEYFYKGYQDDEEDSDAATELHEDGDSFALNTFTDSEALTIAKLYSRIKDSSVRKSLLALVRAMAAPTP
jgi:transcriptional regulator with XRE-family HTH domain